MEAADATRHSAGATPASICRVPVPSAADRSVAMRSGSDSWRASVTALREYRRVDASSFTSGARVGSTRSRASMRFVRRLLDRRRHRGRGARRGARRRRRGGRRHPDSVTRTDAAGGCRERCHRVQRRRHRREVARLRNELLERVAELDVSHDARCQGRRRAGRAARSRPGAAGRPATVGARARTVSAGSWARPDRSIIDSGLRYGHTRPSSSIATVSSDT